MKLITAQEIARDEARSSAQSVLAEQSNKLQEYAPLSVQEKQELEKNEQIIAHGWQTFVDVGRSLTQIRDGRLYRQEFKTFEVYCQQKWQYGRHYAYHLIAAADIVAHLETKVHTPPQHESQVRPLIGLSKEAAVGIWNKAIADANGGVVTAKLVKKAVAEFRTEEPSQKKRRRKKTAKVNPNAAIRDKILQLVKSAQFFLKSQNLENIPPILAEIGATANQITD